MITTTVCGSFRRHLTAIYDSVQTFVDRGVQVLSPADPRVVDAIGGFVFVASDRGRSMRLVEDRHLAAIGASDFVWLVAPDGYVGPSAGLELGYALGSSIPVFCLNPIADATLDLYVRKVESLEQCVRWAEMHERKGKDLAPGQLLLDPERFGDAYLQRMGQHLESVGELRRTMSRTHSAEEVEPLYVAAKCQVPRLLLPHD